MANKNRTWIEDGEFSLPSTTAQSGWRKICLGLLLICLYFIGMSIALTIFWGHYLKIPAPVTDLTFGWKTYFALLKKYKFGHAVLYKTGTVIAFGFVGASLLFRVFLFGKRDKTNKTATLRGTSRWADETEIERAALLHNPGVIVGGWLKYTRNKFPFQKISDLFYLKDNGPTHVLTVGPTRSGKGISLVLPTLLTWTESAFVLDIKGENWLLSSGWRNKAVGPCIRFEPTDPSGTSAHYNPLVEVHLETPNEVREIQNIASMLIDPDGKGLDDHWTKSAFTLLTGALTHELYVAKLNGIEPSIERLREELASGDIKETLVNWEHFNHLRIEESAHKKDGSGAHPTVRKVAYEMKQKAEKELSGVFSSALAALGLWTDPTICMNTTNSTFKINDLVDTSKEPLSLYVVVPPSDLTRLRPILRLFVTQIVFALTQKIELKNEEKRRVLLMLDEFPQLKKLELFEAALAFIGGYGLKAYMICQSYKQLTDIYGKDETVSANCKTQVCFAPNDEDTAKIISEKCGQTTVTVGTSTISGKRFAYGLMGKTQESLSYSQESRALLMPDEVKRLPPAVMEGDKVIAGGDMLIFSSGSNPIYGKQTPFFLDRMLNDRSKIAPQQQSKTSEETSKKPAEEVSVEMTHAFNDFSVPAAPVNEEKENDVLTALEKGTIKIAQEPPLPNKPITPLRSMYDNDITFQDEDENDENIDGSSNMIDTDKEDENEKK